MRREKNERSVIKQKEKCNDTYSTECGMTCLGPREARCVGRTTKGATKGVELVSLRMNDLRLQQGRDIKAHAKEKWGKCSVQWKECEKEKKNTHTIHSLNESGDDYDTTAGREHGCLDRGVANAKGGGGAIPAGGGSGQRVS